MKMAKNLEEKTAIVAQFLDNIIQNIISFLPLKKAFSYGLLSKRFSESWKLSRDLSFNIDQRLVDRADMFNIMKFVMDEHCGPVIKRLRVILDPLGKENHVRNWIQKTIEKGVQELDLDFSSGNVQFLFPTDLLDGACLEVLKNLEMTNSYSEHDLVIQASKLKNFKLLKVVRCSDLLTNMYIDAPGLQVFHYIGEICHIVLKSEMLKIEDVVLHFNPSREINLFSGAEDLMINLRQAKVFSISSPIVERLSAKFSESNYKEFYFCLENIKELHLCLGGSTDSSFIQSTNLNPNDIARFLSKSPSIEKLTIDFGIFPLESGPYWELVAKHEFKNYVTSFKFLNSVCFMNFKFFNLEMEFAAFILESAIVLKHCIIVKAEHYPGTKKDEVDFTHSFATEKFKTTIYEHNQYKSN